MTIVLFIAGLVLLIVGAEVLVRGASRLAVTLGISPLIVGLTVVAWATGSPELAVSIKSVQTGQTDIALGNAIGSNIFNILFILGISASLVPLTVSRRLVRLEVPLMVGASVLLYIMALNEILTRIEGVLLLACTAAYTLFVIVESRGNSMRERSRTEANEDSAAKSEASRGGGWILDLVLIGVGLGMLLLGADWLVNGAVAFAKHLGVSEVVIALTIIAAGTGLPEVATSIVAGLRGQRDLAVGNVVGSNIFNILAVVGVGAVIAPQGIPVPPQLLNYDLPIMVASAVACLPVFFMGYRIARWEGFLFLGYYVAYTTFLVLKATGHVALPMYTTAMIGFVIPLTVITLAIMTGRVVWNWIRKPHAA